MFTTLDKVKKHLNLDNEYKDDDEYIYSLISAAEDATAKRLNVPLYRLVDENTGYIPDSIQHSILLLIGNWYAARETFAFSSVSSLPHSFDFLADLNRNYKEPF